MTGFEQDKVVTFGCNLAGFTVPANSALKCVLNGAADGLTWNGTTPTECQGINRSQGIALSIRAPILHGCLIQFISGGGGDFFVLFHFFTFVGSVLDCKKYSRLK